MEEAIVKVAEILGQAAVRIAEVQAEEAITLGWLVPLWILAILVVVVGIVAGTIAVLEHFFS